MAYDEARSQVVLFGGEDASGKVLNDTWVWDGSTWTEKFPANVPPARTDSAMAYDVQHAQTVMFGGRAVAFLTTDSSAILGDMWSWDGLNWNQIFPIGALPPARFFYPMVYDAMHAQLMLFGGIGIGPGTGPALHDTWTWDGSSWQQLSPSSGPPGDLPIDLAYDTAMRAVILYDEAAEETWLWSGVNWILQPGTGISNTGHGALVDDPLDGETIYFGGIDQSNPLGPSQFLNATWAWRGQSWTLLSSRFHPPSRGYFSMAYDSKRGEAVLFGGTNGDLQGNLLNDTWVWSGTAGPTLPEKAADLARSILRDRYLLGGKGWNWSTSDGRFVESGEIGTGYDYLLYDTTVGLSQILFGRGIDCSGLPFWSYNKAFGAVAYQPCRNPNPVFYEGSDAQYRMNSTALSCSPNCNVADLQPGDLLFFSYDHGWECASNRPGTTPSCTRPGNEIDHVAMYVGRTTAHPEGEVVEAYVTQGVISSSCGTTGGCNRATVDPVLTHIFCSNPNFPNTCTDGVGTLAVCSDPTAATKPCFAGYQRRTSPIINFQTCTHSPVDLIVTDPDGLTITPQTLIVTGREQLREIPGSLYYSEWQIGTDGTADAMVSSPTLKTGDYLIRVVPKPGISPSETYSLEVAAAGTVSTLAENTRVSSIPALGYGISSTGTAIAPFLPVAIDIRPGVKDPPRIEIDRDDRKTIEVAIHSTVAFDAASVVDRSSLTFGRTGNEQSLASCRSHAKHLDDEGLTDLICYFDLRKTGFNVGDVQGVLQGLTVTGQLIKGKDSIRILDERHDFDSVIDR